MENYDPIKAVRQLRDWVEESLSSQNTGALASAMKRYGEITKVIDQLQRLGISVSEDIRSERKALEQLINASKLRNLSKELLTLARDIDRNLGKLRGGRTSAKKLRVTFPDGAVIFEKKAVDTFVNTLRHIGLGRIAELQSVQRHGRHPIVSRERNESAGMVREVDGFFIKTKSSTVQKARQIKDIARVLSIKISVDSVES